MVAVSGIQAAWVAGKEVGAISPVSITPVFVAGTYAVMRAVSVLTTGITIVFGWSITSVAGTSKDITVLPA
jgi:hypothetical protein